MQSIIACRPPSEKWFCFSSAQNLQSVRVRVGNSSAAPSHEHVRASDAPPCCTRQTQTPRMPWAVSRSDTRLCEKEDDTMPLNNLPSFCRFGIRRAFVESVSGLKTKLYQTKEYDTF